MPDQKVPTYAEFLGATEEKRTAPPSYAEFLGASSPSPKQRAMDKIAADYPGKGPTLADIGRSFDPRNILDTIIGGIQGVGSAASGLAGFMGGTAAGLGAQAVGAIKGDPAASTKAREFGGKVAGALTYQPDTQAGQTVAGMLNAPFQGLGELKEKAQDLIGFDPEQKAGSDLAFDIGLLGGAAHPSAWGKRAKAAPKVGEAPAPAPNPIVEALAEAKPKAPEGATAINPEAGFLNPAMIPGVKQPWEMTRNEYLGPPHDFMAEQNRGIKITRYQMDEANTVRAAGIRDHRAAIASAIDAGETVPAEVLLDYRDLQARAFSQPAPKPNREAGFIDPTMIPGVKQVAEFAKSTPKNLADFYENWVDSDVGISRLTKAGEKQGYSPPSYENPMTLAITNRGIDDAISMTFKKGPAKYNSATETYVSRGEGLTPILRDFSDKAKSIGVKDILEQGKDINDFMRDTRIVEDLQRVLPTGAPAASFQKIVDAQANLNRIRAKYGNNIGILETTAVKATKFAGDVRDLGIGTLYSQAERDAMQAANPHYVPFDQILTDVAGNVRVSTGVHTGDILQSANPIKPLKGSTGETYDVIGNLYRYSAQLLKKIDENNRNIQVSKYIDVAPDIVQSVAPKMMPITLEDGSVIFRPSPSQPTPTSIPYRIDGKTHWMDTEPSLYRALINQTQPAARGIWKLVSSITKGLRIGATATPNFWINNVFRDQFSANIQSNIKFRPFIDTIGGLTDLIKNKPLVEEFKRSGASMGGFVRLDRKALEQTFESMVKDKSKFRYLNPIYDLRHISELLEQATRYGLYKAGKKGKLDPLQSAVISRRGTVDFGQHGGSEIAQKANKLYAFFNVGIQGPARTFQAFKENPRNFMVKGIATITIPSIIEYLINRNDEDHENLSPWQKHLFWNIPLGEHRFLPLPKPFLLGQLFGAGPISFLRFVDKKDPDAFNGLIKSIFGSITPVTEPASFIPTFIKPLTEIYSGEGGWSTFRDRAIVSRSKIGLPKAEQYMPYTTEAAKDIDKGLSAAGKAASFGLVKSLGPGPSKVEHLVKGYTGGLGKYALDAYDLGKKTVGAIAGKNDWKGLVPKDMAHLPVVGKFITPPIYEMESPAMNDFYENAKKISSWKTSRTRAGETSGGAAAKAIHDAHPEIALSAEASSLSIRLRDMAKQIDRLRDNEKIPWQTRRDKMNDIDIQMDRIAKKFNAKYDARVKK